MLLGESPTWCANTNTLYWIDIDGKRLHRSTDPLSATGHCETIQLSSIPGAIGLVDHHDNWIWMACSDGIHLLDWSTHRSVRISTFPEASTLRFNDGKVEPSGEAVVVGTMVTESDINKRKGAGKFWRVNFHGSAPPTTSKGSVGMITEDCGKSEVIITGRTIPNGVEWNDDRTLYFVDTYDALISTLTCCDSTPTSLGRIAFETNRLPSNIKHAGLPDGMVKDTQGNLWIAMPGSSLISCFTPEGSLLRSITFPVSKVTSLCFGGWGMRDLFVTSASKGVDRAKEPLAGCVFRVPLAGQGYEMTKLRGNFDRITELLGSRSPLVTQHTVTKAPAITQPHQIKSKL